jgi:DNA adenine methylase
MQSKAIKTTRLSPILKWAGGKEQELKYIHPALPLNIENYYEPFIGGGAVYFSLQAKEMFINDKSHELIYFYDAIKEQNSDFFYVVDEILSNWIKIEKIIEKNKDIFIKLYINFSEGNFTEKELDQWLEVFILQHLQEFTKMFTTCFNLNVDNFLKEIKKSFKSKIKRMSKIEKEKKKLSNNGILENFEASLKSAYYKHFRYLYNNIDKYNIPHGFAVAIFFFIRNYAYSGMFRYNKSGKFNVPYGGIGYNRKNIIKRVKALRTPELIAHLRATSIDNLDFEDFFKKNTPKKNDFIFLDPPYDSEFSTYAKNQFTQQDQVRLALYLTEECEANWMIVIKNTDFIYSLYDKEGIYIRSFNKIYVVSFQNRNDKNAQHLIITNYQ